MSPGPQIRVLLLEDDPADARLVSRMLQRVKTTPFEVAVAGRLADACAMLAASPDGFDVVLADLGVPDSAGIATLDALAAAAPRLPVVVLTGNDDDAVALEAVKRGAQDYLVKGMGDAFILSRVVRYAIERKATEAVLREARDKAEQAARAKSTFLATMGHEIRTPLNGVLGMAQLLLETPLDRRQRSFTETLVSSAELLLGLVNDVLDFARLEAEGLTLDQEPFDVVEAVEEVHTLLAPRAQEKGLGLRLDVAAGLPRLVEGDRLRVRQILFNLVGNAVKFTDQGEVTIAIGGLPGGGLRFSVADTGIGFGPEVRAHLFTEFWQGDSGAARRFAGTGLGLAICRRLTDLMGGSIDCDSTIGKGSVFRVDLPLSPCRWAAARPSVPPAGAIRPLRVLLVDDNEVNLAVAGGLLERRGHSVVAVQDGAAAVDAARDGVFDIILLDMRMPGMDGIDTAKAISALPGPAGRVPMYLLTANPSREDEPRWREAGVRGRLAKPFRLEDFAQAAAEAGLAGGAPPAAVQPPVPLVSAPDLLADMEVLGMERMRALANLFKESSAADLMVLRSHADAGQWADVAKTAHRMAGGAFSLHLSSLAAACRSLEDELRAEPSVPAVGDPAGRIASLWQDSVNALDEFLRR